MRASPGALAAAAALCLGPLAGAAAAAAPHEEAKASVGISDAGFAKIAGVQVGDRVTLVNKGTKPHLAAAKGPVAFASPKLAAGASWTYTFTKPGTYTVLCKLHPAMKPTVIVAAPAAKAAATKAEGANAALASSAKALDEAGAAADETTADDTAEVAAAEPIDTRAGRSTALLVGSLAGVALLGLLARSLPKGQ